MTELKIFYQFEKISSKYKSLSKFSERRMSVGRQNQEEDFIQELFDWGWTEASVTFSNKSTFICLWRLSLLWNKWTELGGRLSQSISLRQSKDYSRWKIRKSAAHERMKTRPKFRSFLSFLIISARGEISLKLCLMEDTSSWLKQGQGKQC